MRLSVLLSFVMCASVSHAAEPSPAPTAEQEVTLLKEVKVPDGFEAKIFAVPPAVNYPVFVAAAPDGTLYVSSDKNGSLDRAPHRGRILRVRDLDGDGHADEVKQFVPDVDSPRGLVWDRDRLYLLHPPNLSVYIDHDGDGIADEEKVLVKNIAFTFKDRPADHSSNGIELGIDGWIYCAIGDFGFMEAEGADGRKMQLRGGGVVRVRPDGSGLELYSRGTRNILEACVSPTLDVFARDNTNDGDGWDIRLHHFTGLSEHGYPSLFKHFKGEFIEPLADYGGGSGCGGLYLSEPGFPEGYGEALYTSDWGREWVYRHQLTPDGATFKIDQHEFVRAPRVTDLDVDASSRIYVSSWKGATFTYVGENVGFLVRVTPKGYTPEPLPDFRKASDTELVRLLESASHRRRLDAQRELLARKVTSEVRQQVEQLARAKEKPLVSRIAAIFFLKQSLGLGSHPFISGLMKDPSVREYAIRALCDRAPAERDLSVVPQIVTALRDENPRVRTAAAIGLERLNDATATASLATALGDSDPTVDHTGVQALRALEAYNVAFDVFDSPLASADAQRAAARVLQRLHKPEVVSGLTTRLNRRPDAQRRRLLLTALCRLYYTDGAWKGDSWGTRPDTSGPYYQPVTWSETDKIGAVLKTELKNASGADAKFLVQEFSRHKIQTDDTLKAVVELARSDANLLPAAVVDLDRAENIPPGAEELLIQAASAEKTDLLTRSHAVSALAKLSDADAAKAMLQAMPIIAASKDLSREVQQARQSFLRARQADQQVHFYQDEAAKLDSNISPWADVVLLNISDSKNASPEAQNAAREALENGWKEPKRKAQILNAIALGDHRASRQRVIDSLEDTNPAVNEAAHKAARALRLDREIKTAKAKQNEPQIASFQTDDIIQRAMTLHGDPKLGEELFTRQACNTCHTVAANEPLRGPFLGNIATIYKRDELARAILLPSFTIAQGFATHHFELKDGTEVDGFVVQEAADSVTIRNVTAQEIKIKTSEIALRKKLDKSIMPEGLVANLTLSDFASLLDYLQSLSKQ
jgi:putative membrane-bound dehydrogenase-like protein